MENIVYIRMKKHIRLSGVPVVHLKDIAFVGAVSPKVRKRLEQTQIYQVTESDSNYIVIDGFIIIRHLQLTEPSIEIQLIGPSQTIIHAEEHKKEMPIWVAAMVWLVLFIGAAMTIMNFHYDVSMQDVQQKLHYLLTGKKEDHPLWIQVPYSIGLGMGMLVFFNHWFKKRFNEEPSPLEVEIYKYQQSLDEYIIDHENKLNDSKRTH